MYRTILWDRHYGTKLTAYLETLIATQDRGNALKVGLRAARAETSGKSRDKL